jgi:CO/xanthine dehydrogenase Mo-binding subunit
VPVHASGPYRVPAVAVRSRAIFTTNPPSGAFRGFGVPQAAIAQEALYDRLADATGIDRLEFRLRNALRPGDTTPSGQVLEHSVGLVDCLVALRPHEIQVGILKRLRGAPIARHTEAFGLRFSPTPPISRRKAS